jgi:hypothetical protein
MTIQDLEQHRGKNYVLHVKTQKEWDSVIPIFRKRYAYFFEKKDFKLYDNIVIYLSNYNKEFMGDLKYVNLKEYKIISLNNSIIEIW